MAAPDVEVRRDAGALAAAAAERLVTLTSAAQHTPFAIALAGGATPRALYEMLATDGFARRLPWHRIELFFGDERAVPPAHPDSNFGMVSRALLAAVDVRVHRMVAERGEAAAYETLLRSRVAARTGAMPCLDLVLLGIGEDGHTASLFPGTAALAERHHAVVMNDVPQLATQRMTLTYPAINAAREVWILATGARKRHVVAGCLGGTAEAWPVRDVAPSNGTLVWWIDEAAAAGVPGLHPHG